MKEQFEEPALKLAVTVWGALMVREWGLAPPLRSPVQLLN